MTVHAADALDTCKRLDLEAAVTGASPQRLMVMLYDGAVKAVYAARSALARGDVAGRGSAITKAIAIVDEGLRPALDLKSGGELATNLAALYDYIVNRLLYANLRQDEASLEEAGRLLSDLKGAWEALERRTRTGAAGGLPELGGGALSYGMA
jgi:flagellar protein FliS